MWGFQDRVSTPCRNFFRARLRPFTRSVRSQGAVGDRFLRLPPARPWYACRADRRRAQGRWPGTPPLPVGASTGPLTAGVAGLNAERVTAGGGSGRAPGRPRRRSDRAVARRQRARPLFAERSGPPRSSRQPRRAVGSRSTRRRTASTRAAWPSGTLRPPSPPTCSAVTPFGEAAGNRDSAPGSYSPARFGLSRRLATVAARSHCSICPRPPGSVGNVTGSWLAQALMRCSMPVRPCHVHLHRSCHRSSLLERSFYTRTAHHESLEPALTPRSGRS